MELTRFYLVLQVLEQEENPEKVAYGIIFFQQDQLHIDLFVFFSVFFSCFFLFLAACVVAWKAKQAADVRRARRRHVNEMLHMAKRPFARVTLNLGPWYRSRQLVQYEVKPVAVEPTGKMFNFTENRSVCVLTESSFAYSNRVVVLLSCARGRARSKSKKLFQMMVWPL